MIAVDTSTLSALLAGEQGRDVDSLADGLARGDVRLPTVVLTEILSDPATAKILTPRLLDLELLTVSEGHWQRAGKRVRSCARAASRRR